MDKLAELNRHYWGLVYDMCEGTIVKPWKCVRYAGCIPMFTSHPTFSDTDSEYEFAVAILEDKPVFVGDKIYSRTTGKKIDWEIMSEVVDISRVIKERWTWHQPKPKRTFTISVNGGDPVELPCPDPGAVYGKSFTFDISGTYFGFISREARDK